MCNLKKITLALVLIGFGIVINQNNINANLGLDEILEEQHNTTIIEYLAIQRLRLSGVTEEGFRAIERRTEVEETFGLKSSIITARILHAAAHSEILPPDQREETIQKIKAEIKAALKKNGLSEGELDRRRDQIQIITEAAIGEVISINPEMLESMALEYEQLSGDTNPIDGERINRNILRLQREFAQNIRNDHLRALHLSTIANLHRPPIEEACTIM